MDNKDDCDFLFIEINEEEEEEQVAPLGDQVDESTGSGAGKSSFGGYRPFHGLSDMSLKQLTCLLEKKNANHEEHANQESPLAAAIPITENHVMKLRSIMRFATEYHNALVVRSAQCSTCKDKPVALLQFLETAEVCFASIYCMVTDSSGTNAAPLEDFVAALQKLKSLEAPVNKEISYLSGQEKQGASVLEQAVGAVVGQMDDFLSLALCANHGHSSSACKTHYDRKF